MNRIVMAIVATMFATIANAASQVDMITIFNPSSASGIFAQEVVNRLNTMQSEYEFRASNLPGAAGDTAALKAIAVARTGQNVLLWHGASAYSYGKYVSANVNAYDRDKDLIPVQSFLGIGFNIMVHPESNINTIDDLVNEYRKKDNVYFGNTSTIAATILLNTVFVKKYNLKPPKELSYTKPYDTSKSILVKESDYTIFTTADVIGLKSLVTSSAVRTKSLPNVPTGKEVGMDDFNYSSLSMVSVPKEKEDFGKKMVGLLNQICNDPTFIERIQKLEYDSKCYGREQIQKIIADDLAAIRKYEKDLVFRP